MHADEVDTDPQLVRRLLAAQFPQWAGLPVRRARRTAQTTRAQTRPIPAESHTVGWFSSHP